MEFVSIDDIALFRNYGGDFYRKGNGKLAGIGESIKTGPMAKTEYWAKLVTDRLPDFVSDMNYRWQKNGYFARYTWARIRRRGEEGLDIFFTVGIDAGGLIVKLDYQRDRSSLLSEAKKAKCESLLKEYAPEWRVIPTESLDAYDWGKLLDETVEFINRYLPVYDDIICSVWKRAARVCWNSHTWTSPSGMVGKSSDEESYENMYGFGHEEWLFDFSKQIDGYQYAFLEPVLKASEREVGETYDFLLWTIDGVEKIRYAVAYISKVEIIDCKDEEKAVSEYRRRGWIRQMSIQVEEVDGDARHFRQSFALNVRFRPENVRMLFPSRIPKSSSIMSTKRYLLTRLYPDDITALEDECEHTYEFVPGHRTSSGNHEVSWRRTESGEVQIRHLHKQISDELTEFLSERFGAENVDQESGLDSRHVDIVVRTGPEDYVFYEIKTYASLRTSVREALGQLLEYAHYPEKKNACKLVVVSHSSYWKSEKKNVVKYVSYLRKIYGVPLYICFYDLRTHSLSPEY